MKINKLIIFILFLIFKATPQKLSNSNPYSVLRLNHKASKIDVKTQYKKLKQKNSKNQTNKSKIKKAQLQIMSQRARKGKSKLIKQSKSQKSKLDPLPRAQNEPYMYGYRISFQFNDGKNFRATYNQSQFIIDRSNASITYKRIYALILLFGSMLLKIMPCLLLICLCQCKANQGTVQSIFQRARTGYSPILRPNNTRRGV